MTAENGIRTENKMKRLAAAIGVALAAVLAAASLSPARAATPEFSVGNLVIDVPTTVPCALMADGTVVGPSDWAVKTSGGAYIASASASGFPANVEWSARTTDLAAAQTGAVEVAGAGDAASVSGPSDPASAKLAPSAGFEWAFSKLDAGKNSDIIAKAAGGTAVLGSVTFTFAKTEPDAFAVYSADDNSLTFYKRAGVPVAGQTFEGKTATEVFAGFETEEYGSAGSVPWAGHAADIASVAVADEGIAPVSTAYWFFGMRELRSADLLKLDMGSTTDITGMFASCKSLTSLDLSSFDTRKVENMYRVFYNCKSLTSLDLSSFDTGVVTNMDGFFGRCDSLERIALGAGFDWVGQSCRPPAGNWKSASTGKLYAESEIPSGIADTYTYTRETAFAVYSADDNSLTFYKRVAVPAVGEVFEGKAATEVFTGFETETYDFRGNVPWADHAADIASAAVADEGISPVSTAYWFIGMQALRSADLSKLDTSNVTDMQRMFDGCPALTTLDLSTFDTGKVNDISYAFYGCESLASLDLSTFDTSNVRNMTSLFEGCSALTSLDLSSFNTTNVTDMTALFYDCKSLTTLDLSSFDTRKVEKLSGLFGRCFALTSLDLSTFDTRNIADMRDVFDVCLRLQEVTFGENWEWNGTNGYLPTPDSSFVSGADGKWYDTDGNGYAPADIPSNKAMTYTAVAPKKAFAVYCADDGSLSFYNRSEVPKQGSMFLGKKATAVYTGFETSTSVPGWMLNYHNDIKTVTVCDKGISPISTSSWFQLMSNLKTADVSKLDMSKCKAISCMFTNCTSLETLDLSAWDTRSLKTMNQAFQNCTSLTELNVSGWDVSHVTDMDLAFAEDHALARLDLSTWDNSAVTTMKDAFLPMNSLSEISLGSKFKFVGTRPFLPVQTGHVTGADGKWYDTDGNGYAPEDIPSNKAMIYTAVAPKKAFAVYSADDDSLNLYKRAAVPAAGEQFEGKAATEVYEGVEEASYTATDGAPWAGHADELASVKVADAGIAPVSTAYWFRGASKLSSVSLAGLDTSQTTCMDGMFEGCSSLESLDLSAMSTRRVASMTAFLGGCDSLAELSIGSGFAWVGDGCYPPAGDWKQESTGTDYPESDIPTNKTDKYTRTKTAFAVYSADDQSLTFYKRPVAPAEGAQFLGKTASKVFTGFETGTYSPSSVPWAAYRSNVKAVTVVDEGIAPTSTARWFYLFTNAASIDLSKLDTRNVTDMSWMFYSCQALTALDVSSFGTGSVTSMLCMFSECVSLTSLDLSSFDTGGVTDMRSMFQDCNALTALDISSFDTGSLTNAASMFSECVSLERISLGTGFKWVGWNCYPRSGSWESSSTGKVYSEKEIPSGVADTYVFKPNTEAYAAVNAASDPVSDETAADVAKTGTVAASANKAKDESAAQKAVEGVPSLEEKASSESDAATGSECAKKATAVKSGE